MQGRIVIAEVALEHERHLQVGLQFRNDFEDKVEHVAAPVARLRGDAVGPPGIHPVAAVFLIIQEVVGKYRRDLIFVAEHKQSRHRRMEPTGVLIFAHSADPAQKHGVVLMVPQMLRTDQLEDVAVGLYGLWTEHRHIEFSQQPVVVGHQR